MRQTEESEEDKKRLRSEMSIKSKTFDRRFSGVSVMGVGCFSGKDARWDAGSGWELCRDRGRDGDDDDVHDGIAAEVVAGSKVCELGAGSGSPFPVRTGEVTVGKSFRTDRSRQGCGDGENGRPSFR